MLSYIFLINRTIFVTEKYKITYGKTGWEIYIYIQYLTCQVLLLLFSTYCHVYFFVSNNLIHFMNGFVCIRQIHFCLFELSCFNCLLMCPFSRATSIVLQVTLSICNLSQSGIPWSATQQHFCERLYYIFLIMVRTNYCMCVIRSFCFVQQL